MVDAPRTALGAHHQRGLAGIGGEDRLASRALRDVAGQRRLADARVPEQAEQLGLAGFQPAADLVDRLGLFARPLAANRLRGRGRRGGRGGLPRRGGQILRLPVRALRLPVRAAARADGRLAAEVVIFGAAGQALTLGSEPAERRLAVGQKEAPPGPSGPGRQSINDWFRFEAQHFRQNDRKRCEPAAFPPGMAALNARSAALY